MNGIPPQLLDGLCSIDHPEVAAWWAALPQAAQREIGDLCAPEQEQQFVGSVAGHKARARPILIGGRFVPRDDTAGWQEWHAEYFEHLLCNPELVIWQPPIVRTFRVCTRHEAVRTVLAAGRLPANFQCPLEAEECAIRRILSLAPGESLRLAPIDLETDLVQQNDPHG
jgi:hypothetical protein